MTEAAAEVKNHPWNRSFAWNTPPGPYRALTAEQAGQFDRDGFIVLPNVFDAETVAEVTVEREDQRRRERRTKE